MQSTSDNTAVPVVLESFSTNLTKDAVDGKLDPVIGRDKEIDDIINVLSRRRKNNAMLTGESGVGKTSIIEGLAMRIADGNVPQNLRDKKIYSLNINSLVSGTSLRGDFEKRIDAIFTEVKKHKNIILFIDEIHTMIGAGATTGSSDMADTIKPELSRGEMCIIGTTTTSEYRKHFEKDEAICRRFENLIIDEPSIEATEIIANNVKHVYEQFHGVNFSADVINKAVRYSDIYITGRKNPDKIIDVIDSTATNVKLSNTTKSESDEILELRTEIEKTKQLMLDASTKQDWDTALKCRDSVDANQYKLKELLSQESIRNSIDVTLDDVLETISKLSGIPVTNLGMDGIEDLKALPDKIKDRVIGQDEHVEVMCNAIKRARLGISSHDKPNGVFLLLGSTGTGKTETAKAIAQHTYGDEKSIIRINMSDYAEEFNASKMFGAPPGYVGYEEGGELTNAVKNKPYSVVLLDEIEKAHPKIFNNFLQIFDDGYTIDSLGKRIDFSNTIIIMTSNVGVKKASEHSSIGFNNDTKTTDDHRKTVIMKELKELMQPELLNRIDEVLIYNYLDKDTIFKIAEKSFSRLVDRLKISGYNITKISDDLITYVADNGFDEKFGARPINRFIQSFVETKLTEYVLDGKIDKTKNYSLGLSKKDELIIKKTR